MSNPRRVRFPVLVLILVLIPALMFLGACGKKSGGEGRTSGGTQVAEEPAAETSARPSAGVQKESPPAEAPAPAKPPVRVEEKRRDEPRVPDFSLVDMEGRTLRMADLRGRVVLIDFWATWCGPCRMEIPHLIDLHRDLSSEGFTVLGISVDQKGPSVVRPFVASNKIPYPVVMADQATVEKFGGIRAVPTAFLVDREGYIVGKYEGYRDRTFLEKEIRKALSATPVS